MVSLTYYMRERRDVLWLLLGYLSGGSHTGTVVLTLGKRLCGGWFLSVAMVVPRRSPLLANLSRGHMPHPVYMKTWWYPVASHSVPKSRTIFCFCKSSDKNDCVIALVGQSIFCVFPSSKYMLVYSERHVGDTIVKAGSTQAWLRQAFVTDTVDIFLPDSSV